MALAYVYLIVGIGTATYIAFDLRKHTQKMKIMNIVWPVNGFCLGPTALWAYWHMGHSKIKQKGQNTTITITTTIDHPAQTHKQKTGSKKPMSEMVFVSATHCGAGCMLGDIVGEWVVFLGGLSIAGAFLWSYYIVDYALAWILGILFQNASIMQMKNKSFKEGLSEAIKADALSLSMVEIGLFGWMAFSYFMLFGGTLHPINPIYWFSMQIGMILGFFTSYPANWWLVKRGIKEGM